MDHLQTKHTLGAQTGDQTRTAECKSKRLISQNKENLHSLFFPLLAGVFTPRQHAYVIFKVKREKKLKVYYQCSALV